MDFYKKQDYLLIIGDQVMKLTKNALIKLIKEEVENHFSEEEEMEHQPLDAYWSGTNEEGLVTTKDGHQIVVKATTDVEDLKKVASALEALGVRSIATEDDPVPEVSILDLLKTMHLGGKVVGGL